LSTLVLSLKTLKQDLYLSLEGLRVHKTPRHRRDETARASQLRSRIRAYLIVPGSPKCLEVFESVFVIPGRAARNEFSSLWRCSIPVRLRKIKQNCRPKIEKIVVSRANSRATGHGPRAHTPRVHGHGDGPARVAGADGGWPIAAGRINQAI
jgi:hypothetical protein